MKLSLQARALIKILALGDLQLKQGQCEPAAAVIKRLRQKKNTRKHDTILVSEMIF